MLPDFVLSPASTRSAAAVLPGPVVAAACILDLDKPLPEGLDDSKKLTPEKREEIADRAKADCVAYAIGQVEADEIDRINILEATKKAMLLAIDGLEPAADFLLIDALQLNSRPSRKRRSSRATRSRRRSPPHRSSRKPIATQLMAEYALAYPRIRL